MYLLSEKLIKIFGHCLQMLITLKFYQDICSKFSHINLEFVYKSRNEQYYTIAKKYESKYKSHKSNLFVSLKKK